MKKMTSETFVRILADGELITVSGGCRTVHRKPWPHPKSVSQSNSVGDVSVSAGGNSGDISVTVSQSNSVA